MAWQDYWSSSFGARLSQGESSEYEHSLFRSAKDKISNLKHPEIKDAIDSMVADGYGVAYNQKKPSLPGLRRAIFINRKGAVPSIKDVYHKKMLQIRSLMLAEPDRLKRWEIMCDQTPDSIEGSRMCQELENLADRPDMTEHFENVRSIFRKLENIPEDQKDWTERQRGAHKLLEISRRTRNDAVQMFEEAV